MTKGLPVTWRPSRAEWVHVDELRHYDASEEDFVIGTFWVTVPVAHAIAGDWLERNQDQLVLRREPKPADDDLPF